MKKLKCFKLVIVTLINLTLVLQLDPKFAYAGKAESAATSIINTQVEEQTESSQGAEGGSGYNPNRLNGTNLSNALNSAESAGAASGQQSSGAGFNMAMSGVMAVMGAGLIATGSIAKPSPDWTMIAMGGFMLLQSAQALMQSMNQGKTSKINEKAGTNFQTYDIPSDPTNPNNGTGADDTTTDDKSTLAGGFGSTTKGLTPEAQSILKKIEDAGYKVDLNNGTFTTPDGKSIALSSANNASAVESQLGFPPGTYEKGMGLVQDIAKRQGVSTPGAYDSPSGGGMNAMNDGSNSGLDGAGKKQDGQTRTPASALVAGLSSKYNGENIGVAADDIFMMVTRRYQVKSLQNSFITPEHPERGMLISPMNKSQAKK